jgi:SnoaL-like domain
MTTLDPVADAATVQTVKDRLDIADVIYRYASTIDRFDFAGTRSVLADDLWAQYGNAEPLVGGDAVADWIAEACKTVVWQHHLLSVYHVVVDGDRAKALVYHTSHQQMEDDPEGVFVLVARYHDELTRTSSGWKISKLVFEIGWGERRPDTGFLAAVGGRGPQVP